MSPSDVKPLMIKAVRWTLSLGKDDVSATKRDMLSVLNNSAVIRLMQREFKGAPFKKFMGRPMDDIENDSQSTYATLVKPVAPSTAFMSVYEYLGITDTTAVPQSSQLTDFYAKYKEDTAKIADDAVTKELRSRDSFGTKTLPFRVQTIKPDDVNLGKYYCPDGQRHKFDIYVTKGKGKKEYTSADIAAMLESGKRMNLKIVDERCSVCGTLRSKAKNTGIARALDYRDKTDAFYRYYAMKCPVKGVHSIKNGRCTKCDYTKPTAKYYAKWKKTYTTAKAESAVAQAAQVTKVVPVQPPTKQKKFAPWKVINTNVLRLAELTKFKYNVLINIGLSEGLPFARLEEEKENRHVNISPEDAVPRNAYLLGYIMMMFKYIYTIKSHEHVFEMPGIIAPLFAKQKAIGLKGLSKAIPEIYDNFNEKAYQYSTNPVLLSNYMIDFLAKSLLDFNKALAKTPFSKFALAVTKVIIKKIIEAEKMVSEPNQATLKYMDPTFKPIDDEDLESEAQDGVPEVPMDVEVDPSGDVDFSQMDVDDDDLANLEGNAF
jgi:hypothetical protein